MSPTYYLFAVNYGGSNYTAGDVKFYWVEGPNRKEAHGNLWNYLPEEAQMNCEDVEYLDEFVGDPILFAEPHEKILRAYRGFDGKPSYWNLN